MKTKFILLALTGCAAVWIPSLATAAAGGVAGLELGHTAPAEIVLRIQADAPVQIGAASVRPVPADQNGMATRSAARSGPSTLVVRSSDNLVGVSANELVVIDQDPQAVRRKVAQLSADASIKVYVSHGITIVRLKRFADLQPLRQALAQAFPAARFDLPVKYFDTRTR